MSHLIPHLSYKQLRHQGKIMKPDVVAQHALVHVHNYVIRMHVLFRLMPVDGCKHYTLALYIFLDITYIIKTCSSINTKQK